jgi:hypothetical protein
MPELERERELHPEKYCPKRRRTGWELADGKVAARSAYALARHISCAIVKPDFEIEVNGAN